MSKRLLVLVTFVFCSSLFGQNKPGGVCFRFDDNQPLSQMRQIAAIFDKYSLPFCWSINADALPRDSDYLQFVRSLQLKGCEIMDHAPNHCTQAFWTDHVASYLGRPGVDHVNGTTICLKLQDIDSTNLFSPGEVSIAKNFTVLSTDERLKRNLILGNILVGISAKRLLRINEIRPNTANRTDTLIFSSYWGEEVNEMPTLTLKYALINVYTTRLTDDAVKLLAEEALRTFGDVGLNRPTTFIHPGGFEPLLSTATIKRIYGDLNGYTAAATDGGLRCYNDVNPLGPFCMQWGSFTAGVDVARDKKTISDMIAKHFFLIGGNHLWDIGIDWNIYLVQLDSLLSWCNQQHITVTTYSQIADILYSQVPDPYSNVFPLLRTDLNADGYPDGYDNFTGSIDSIVVDGKSYPIVKRFQEGILFSIHALAGLEKGFEDFRFRAKGNIGATISLKTRIQERKDSTVYSFVVKDTGWNIYGLTGATNDGSSLYMPPVYAYRNFELSLSNLQGAEFDMGQIALRKRSKSDYVLPPYLGDLKVDTTSKRLEFTVDLRDQSHRTVIEKSFGSNFFPFGTTSNTEVLSDVLSTNSDSITYRAYSVSDTTVSEYAYLYVYPRKSLLEDVASASRKSITLACFPNPFNPTINILYSLDRESVVTIRIFDIAGRLVRTLFAGAEQSRGDHLALWDASNNAGMKVASGVYLCRYQISSNQSSKQQLLTKKIIYLK